MPEEISPYSPAFWNLAGRAAESVGTTVWGGFRDFINSTETDAAREHLAQLAAIERARAGLPADLVAQAAGRSSGTGSPARRGGCGRGGVCEPAADATTQDGRSLMPMAWSLLQEAAMPELLADLLNPTGQRPDWVCLLLAADPPESTTLTRGDLVEPTVTGYSPKILHRPDWVIGVPAAGCVHATMPTHPPTWKSTLGSCMVYGFAFMRPADSALVLVARYDDDSIRVWNVGETFSLAPSFGLSSALC